VISLPGRGAFGKKLLVGLIIDSPTSPTCRRPGSAPLKKSCRGCTAEREWMELAKFCSSYYQRPWRGHCGRVAPADTQPPAIPDPERLCADVHGKRSAFAALPTRGGASGLADATRAGTRLGVGARGTSARSRGPLRHGIEAGWVAPVAAAPSERASFARKSSRRIRWQRWAFARRLDKFASACFSRHRKRKDEISSSSSRRSGARHRPGLGARDSATPALEPHSATDFRAPAYHSDQRHAGTGTRARWLAAHCGRAHIVLGTRLAVFASLPAWVWSWWTKSRHFLQAARRVRYSARDLAITRATCRRSRRLMLGDTFPRDLSARNLGQVPAHLPYAPARSTLRPCLRHLVDTRVIPPRTACRSARRRPYRPPRPRRAVARLLIGAAYAPVLACPACGGSRAALAARAHGAAPLGAQPAL